MTATAIGLPARRDAAAPMRPRVGRRHDMTGEPNLDGRDGRARPDADAAVRGLERLREGIGRRLERLEALARERIAPATATPPEPAELQRTLRRRIAEFEEAQRRLREQADRREQEWRESLEQLEADRRLLADAWDRLERERVESPAPPQPGPPGGRPAAERAAAPHPHRGPDVDGDDDGVAHAILKQFQALRNDVRSNAGNRGPS
jgi:hypothetical protein